QHRVDAGHRVGREDVERDVAAIAQPRRSADQVLGGLELAEEAARQASVGHRHQAPSSWASSALSSFTSDSGTKGKTRRNRRNRNEKKQMVPVRMPRSTQVGVKLAQLEGRKSCCSDSTMMTKRSDHMPIWTASATRKSSQPLARTRRL